MKNQYYQDYLTDRSFQILQTLKKTYDFIGPHSDKRLTDITTSFIGIFSILEDCFLKIKKMLRWG